MGVFWHDYLYNPLLNFLFFLYNGPALGNLGVAIIELTVLLRLLLLPLSIVDERSRYRYEKLDRHVQTIKRDFKDDPIKMKEKVRELLRQHKVNYWSKVGLLGVQALVLVLLYQVFVGGIKFTRQEVLYSWVQMPAEINTLFLGFDIGAHNLFWAGLVGALLFAKIYTEQKQRVHLVTKSDIMYLFTFPLFTFAILAVLPMVKSIFILTSMLFTMLVFAFRKALFKVKLTE
ncbi:MAG: YidC/Oxa1 family membrane protein insertase [Patescibacteria group bacterium]